MWDRRAEYLSNYDGDTVKMVLDQGFGDTKLVEIRLMGVYAPEISDIGGPECREFLRSWVEKHSSILTRWDLVVTTARMKIADREQKTIDRYVATVTSLDGTENLNLAVMQYILANGYGGGIGAS